MVTQSSIRILLNTKLGGCVGGAWGWGERGVIGDGSGAVPKTKKVTYSYNKDSENSLGSSSELVAIGTKTDHSMSDAQAIYTHFEKAHKGETSQ